MADLTMLLWSLRTWPKAQSLARALGIPPDAWEFPFLMVPVGGPEISVFEGMERPNFGGLGDRLKALCRPLAAAVHVDPWVKREVIGDSKLAVAYHTGATVDQVRELSTRDGYRVVSMAEALAERGDDCAEDLSDEGLLERHAGWRRRWRDDGKDDAAILQATLALPVWGGRHHSAAFFVASEVERWAQLVELGASAEALDALTELVLEDVAHPVLAKRLAGLEALSDETRARAEVLGRRRRP